MYLVRWELCILTDVLSEGMDGVYLVRWELCILTLCILTDALSEGTNEEILHRC